MGAVRRVRHVPGAGERGASRHRRAERLAVHQEGSEGKTGWVLGLGAEDAGMGQGAPIYKVDAAPAEKIDGRTGGIGRGKSGDGRYLFPFAAGEVHRGD